MLKTATTKPTQIAQFEAGDYVLYTEVRVESENKLRTTWNGPAQVVKALSDWVFIIKNLITGDEREVHASRFKFYFDKNLELTGELLNLVAHNSEGHVVEKINGHRYDKPNAMYELRVKWKGLQDAESTRNQQSNYMKMFLD